MKKSLFLNLVLLTGSILICLAAAELAVRSIGGYDPDGNFIIFGRTLKPFHLPVRTTREKADVYISSDRTRIMYDADLGWAPRKNYTSSGSLYAYNSLGARIDPARPVEYSEAPAPGALRIVLVGDSYTHGDEVSFEDSFGRRLEAKLNESGVRAEVINLAVGAYGMDQAYLRWLRIGAGLSPHIVVFGLQMENVQRNVNLIKPLYQPNTGLPFSKPRFLTSEEGLKLINVPCLPPDRLPATLEKPADWDFSKYEYFLRPEDYRPRAVLRSKSAALAFELLFPVEADPTFYNMNREPAGVTLEIVKTFQNEVEAKGSRLLIVHIPTFLDLLRSKVGREPPYAGLLAAIEESRPVIRVRDTLLDATGWLSFYSFFMPGGHYSGKGNDLIAREVADRIIGELKLSKSGVDAVSQN